MSDKGVLSRTAWLNTLNTSYAITLVINDVEFLLLHCNSPFMTTNGPWWISWKYIGRHYNCNKFDILHSMLTLRFPDSVAVFQSECFLLKYFCMHIYIYIYRERERERERQRERSGEMKTENHTHIMSYLWSYIRIYIMYIVRYICMFTQVTTKKSLNVVYMVRKKPQTLKWSSSSFIVLLLVCNVSTIWIILDAELIHQRIY